MPRYITLEQYLNREKPFGGKVHIGKTVTRILSGEFTSSTTATLKIAGGKVVQDINTDVWVEVEQMTFHEAYEKMVSDLNGTNDLIEIRRKDLETTLNQKKRFEEYKLHMDLFALTLDPANFIANLTPCGFHLSVNQRSWILFDHKTLEGLYAGEFTKESNIPPVVKGNISEAVRNEVILQLRKQIQRKYQFIMETTTALPDPALTADEMNILKRLLDCENLSDPVLSAEDITFGKERLAPSGYIAFIETEAGTKAIPTTRYYSLMKGLEVLNSPEDDLEKHESARIDDPTDRSKV